jgi:hypothetical protein
VQIKICYDAHNYCAMIPSTQPQLVTYTVRYYHVRTSPKCIFLVSYIWLRILLWLLTISVLMTVQGKPEDFWTELV